MRMYQTLASRQQRLDLRDIYAGHAVILDEMLAMFDESVWALRDEVRHIEKVDFSLSLQDVLSCGLIRPHRVEMSSLGRTRTTLSCTTLQDMSFIQPKL